jgi:hypothetical protein
MNRYGYVLNNPTGFIDPSGLFTLPDPPATDPSACDDSFCDAGGGGGVGNAGGGGGGGETTPANPGNPFTFKVNVIGTLITNFALQRTLLLTIPFDLLGNIGGGIGAPSNPTCSVLVKCRGIEYKHLGLLGAEHCDARATDSSGVTHSLSGGPDGDPLNSTLNAWDTPNPTIPFTGWTVYNNPNSCTLAACVINSTNQYHNSPGHPQYNGVSGPNSNTWLKGTFSGCGATLPINTLGGIW